MARDSIIRPLIMVGLAQVLFGQLTQAGDEQRDRLWYEEPAEHWEEALPLGNGRLGAMVFGGVHTARFQLNEDTLWSGGPTDWNNPDAAQWLPKVREAIFAGDFVAADRLTKNMQGPFTQSYQPLGDLELVFETTGEPTNYRRELDLRRGITTTTFTLGDTTYTRETFISVPDQVMCMRIITDGPDTISFRANLSSPLRHEVIGERSGERIIMRGRAPSHVEPNYRNVEPAIVYDDAPGGAGMRFAAVLRARAEGGSVRADDSGVLIVDDARSVDLLFSAATSFVDFKSADPPDALVADAAAKTALDAAITRTPGQLLDRHVADHAGLYDRMSIDLGPSRADLPTDQRIAAYTDEADPDLVALLFRYGRYLLMASSRPGTQPANLQGIWNHQMRPPWSSNWTMNINSEMNYWPAEVANLSECHEPMLRFIGDLAINGRDTARIVYGADGWCAHHNADIWRQTAPVGAYGQGWPGWANIGTCGAWHCMDLWEHFAFTQDLAWLGETGYPVMRGAAVFCLDMLVEEIPGADGHLVLAPSVSAENAFFDEDGNSCAVSMMCTQDIAIVRDLFANCIEASRLLDVDGDFRKSLEAALNRILPYQIGARGQLQEWFRDFKEPEPRHRHLSHLIGMHPGREITLQDTPDLAKAVRRSLELRGDESTGWSMAWKVNLWARLADGNHALKMLGYLLNLVDLDDANYRRGGIYPNLFDAHPPFQIDGNFGVTAGIAEMLVQSHRRTDDGDYIIDLLPALPDAWPTGGITGVRARGGFTVDLQWTDGKASRAVVRSERGGQCVVVFNGRAHPVELDPGASFAISD